MQGGLCRGVASLSFVPLLSFCRLSPTPASHVSLESLHDELALALALAPSLPLHPTPCTQWQPPTRSSITYMHFHGYDASITSGGHLINNGHGIEMRMSPNTSERVRLCTQLELRPLLPVLSTSMCPGAPLVSPTTPSIHLTGNSTVTSCHGYLRACLEALLRLWTNASPCTAQTLCETATVFVCCASLRCVSMCAV